VINDVLVKPLDGVTRIATPGPPISARPGGAAANQAAWMAHLGADVVFAGRVGARDVAYHRRELARAGVRARLAADREAETGSIVIMVEPDGERTMFTDRGANLRLRRADVPARLLDGAAALHLTGYTFCEPPLLEVALWLLGQARARGLAVTIDPGSAAFLARMGPTAFLRWTDGRRGLLPQPRRGRRAHRRGRAGRHGARLTRHYGVVVVKLGGAGCVLAVPGEPPGPDRRPPRAGHRHHRRRRRLLRRLHEPLAGRPRRGLHPCRESHHRGLTTADLTPASLTTADLIAAAGFAVQVAATVVTRFGARPV
jgi:Sugar kinases, ribokinase family